MAVAGRPRRESRRSGDNVPAGERRGHQCHLRPAAWLAVKTHSVLWSLPLGLDGPGHRLRDSFTFVPALDHHAVWVEVRLGDRSRLVALDGDGHVVNTLELPERWRLHADTRNGFVIGNIDAGLLATFVGGTVQIIAEDVHALDARSGARVVWTRGDDAILGLTDVATGRTDEIRHPSVAEWQTTASFSPDGRYLAIGGYADPREPSPPSFAGAMAAPHQARRAFMTLIQSATGTCELMQGQFHEFAWTPTWSTDASWVIFGAPFQGRPLYAFRRTEGVLHTLTFLRQPPMPMLDVTGSHTVAVE